MRKERSLVRIIEIENPASRHHLLQYKSTVHYLTVVLKRFGYDAGELSLIWLKGMRKKLWARVRRGALRF